MDVSVAYHSKVGSKPYLSFMSDTIGYIWGIGRWPGMKHWFMSDSVLGLFLKPPSVYISMSYVPYLFFSINDGSSVENTTTSIWIALVGDSIGNERTLSGRHWHWNWETKSLFSRHLLWEHGMRTLWMVVPHLAKGSTSLTWPKPLFESGIKIVSKAGSKPIDQWGYNLITWN